MSESYVNQLPGLDEKKIQAIIAEVNGLQQEAMDLKEHLGIKDDETDVIDPGLPTDKLASSDENERNATPQPSDMGTKLHSSTTLSAETENGSFIASQQSIPAKPPAHTPQAQPVSTTKPTTVKQTLKPNSAPARQVEPDKIATSPSSQPQQAGKKPAIDQTKQISSSTGSDDDSQHTVEAFNKRLQDWQQSMETKLSGVGNKVSSTVSDEQLSDLKHTLQRLKQEIGVLLQTIASIPGVSTDGFNFVQSISDVVRETDSDNKQEGWIKTAEKKKKKAKEKKKKKQQNSSLTRGLRKVKSWFSRDREERTR